MKLRLPACVLPIIGLFAAPATADSVSVAGLVQRQVDDAAVSQAEVVLSATRAAGGKLAGDQTTGEGVYNLTSSAVLDTIHTLFVWTEYPRPTSPQQVSLIGPTQGTLRTSKPHAIKVPPATGSLSTAQASRALVGVAETESLKAHLELLTKEEASARIHRLSIRLLARHALIKNDNESVQQLSQAVEAVPRQKWLADFLLPAEPLFQLRDSADFRAVFAQESEQRAAVLGRLRTNDLRPGDVDYLLGMDATQIPVDAFPKERVPRLFEVLLERRRDRGPNAVLLVAPKQRRPELAARSLLRVGDIENADRVMDWLEATPEARELYLDVLLLDLPHLTEKQQKTALTHRQHTLPLIVLQLD